MRSPFVAPRLIAVSLLLLLVGCQPDDDVLKPPQAPSLSTASEADASASATRSTAEASVPAAAIQPVAAAGNPLQRRLEDASTEARVTKALAGVSDLRVFDFRPRVRNQRLVITGDVNTMSQHRRVERVLKQVRGVERIINKVTVAGRSVEATRAMIAEAKANGQDPSSQADGAYYTVRSGDTLWQIARRHRASVQQIKQLNQIRGSSLQPGQRLRVR
jgi:LysM repeat protein